MKTVYAVFIFILLVFAFAKPPKVENAPAPPPPKKQLPRSLTASSPGEPPSELRQMLKCLEGKPGCRPAFTAYYAGAWTLGWGHANHVRAGQTMTREQAEEALTHDIAAAEQCVSTAITVPMFEHEKDALTSFAFNTGCGGFQRAGLARAMNEGRWRQVPALMSSWVRSGGVRMGGLVKRRSIETALFTQGPEGARAAFDKAFPGGWEVA